MTLPWKSDWRDVTEDDIDRVAKQLRAGQLNVVSGGVLVRFERAFAQFAGTRHAVAFNSGTSALYAAIRALGLRPGDEVMLPDYGFHGMAAAVLAAGAKVAVCDVEPAGLTMSPAALAEAITPRTKAVLVHHPWGVPADLAALRAVTDLPIVSDASHAHGALCRDRPLAAGADITCYSLGMGKLISGGELGCAVTDRADLRDAMVIEGHVNRVPHDLLASPWTGNAVGLKLRPHAAALTLASGQLRRFDEKSARIAETAREIETAAVEAGFTVQSPPCPAERAYWQIHLRCPTPEARDGVVSALREAGMPARADEYRPSLQHQPLFSWPTHIGQLVPRACPTAAQAAATGLLITAPAGLDRASRDGLAAAFATALR